MKMYCIDKIDKIYSLRVFTDTVGPALKQLLGQALEGRILLTPAAVVAWAEQILGHES